MLRDLNSKYFFHYSCFFYFFEWHRYVECNIKGEETVKMCPDGLVFDIYTQNCDYPSKVDCSLRPELRKIIKVLIQCPPINLITDNRINRLYCNQKLLTRLYFNSIQNTSVNWIIHLLLSLLFWPKVILLSGRHCIRKPTKKNINVNAI